jgi:hypothetical protein
MTIKEKSDKLYQSFLAAWEHYKKIEKENTHSTGFTELLSNPTLKTAYQKWQSAVSDYYDFARSVENQHMSAPYTGK